MRLRSFVHNRPVLALVTLSFASAVAIALLDQWFLVLGFYFYSFHPFLLFLYQFIPKEWDSVQRVLSETIFWFVLVGTLSSMSMVSRRYSTRSLFELSVIFSVLFTLATLTVMTEVVPYNHGSTYESAMGLPYHYLFFWANISSNLYSTSNGTYQLAYFPLLYDLVAWFGFYLGFALVARYIPVDITLRAEDKRTIPPKDTLYVKEEK